MAGMKRNLKHTLEIAETAADPQTKNIHQKIPKIDTPFIIYKIT
jgi:hypothetical protein